MDRNELKEKAKKQIILAVIAGALLLLADLAVSMSNDGIEIKSSGGKSYMARPAEGEKAGNIYFRVEVQGDKEVFKKNVAVKLSPYGEVSRENNDEDSLKKEMTQEEQVDRQLKEIVNGFNENTEIKAVRLPDRLESGEKISWEKERSGNTAIITIFTMLTAALIYKNRFKALEKKQQMERDSVIRQLPEFVNRLVLLLNAGLVLNSAFEKSVEESIAFKNGEKDYFYSRMKDIYLTVSRANGSMYKEFRDFAKASGVKEVMRISNIINDNIHKGVELTQKLQAESELLWMNRKKSCEEKGRLAETKLTLPLMIFLMVLIVITVCPALLEL